MGPQWQEMVEPATAVITSWNPNWRTMAHTDSGMAGAFVVDKLDYLAKGGRCSSVVALGANLLKLANRAW